MEMITFVHGIKIKIWAGYYQHTKVFKNNILIGTIQSKKQYKRYEYITLNTKNQCVVGINKEWLIRQS